MCCLFFLEMVGVVGEYMIDDIIYVKYMLLDLRDDIIYIGDGIGNIV